ncbi:MAG: D-alanyl-D-alanine carboxypeptidase family protein [Clostridia bacterium]|nr:D-alanyl-D-alanine carboxypeptidase family protein [Clostridia bacterium]
MKLKRQRQRKILISVFTLICAVVLVVLFFAVGSLIRENALLTFADGKILIAETQNGGLDISWPVAEGASSYFVEITDEEKGTVFSSFENKSEKCHVSSFPPSMGIRISIPENKGKGQTKEAANLSPGADLGITYEKSEKDGKIYLSWKKGLKMDVYVLTAKGEESIGSFTSSASFDPLRINGLSGDSITVYMDPSEEGKGYTLKYRRQEILVASPSKDKSEEDLVLDIVKQGEYLYRLSWNDVESSSYTVKQEKDGEWKELYTFGGDVTECSVIFREPYSEASYRVETKDKTSNSCVVRNESCVIYSTVWPIKDLTVYSDPAGKVKAGTVKKGTTLCVLAEENGKFLIRDGKTEGYIDCDYCMIDLYEMYGDLFSYDITNAYSSLFIFHDYKIPGVTGKVIPGYEHMMHKDGTFVVPLLYPVTSKLEQAAFRAREQGMRLRIYESFRPQKATQETYKTAKNFADSEIPGKGMTYAEYISDKGRYPLDRFLSHTTSRHNRGVALDLTLEADGEELSMQTDMHDLSWNAETKRNNDNSKLLEEIMKNSGFAGLTAEWWHFQDDDAKNSYNPPPLYEGVSSEGFTKDDIGWRYRNEDGTYLTNGTVNIDGKDYSFDKEGYLKGDF